MWAIDKLKTCPKLSVEISLHLEASNELCFMNLTEPHFLYSAVSLRNINSDPLKNLWFLGYLNTLHLPEIRGQFCCERADK